MIEVDYVSHMGSDDTVCDAARVSFDKAANMYTPEQNERLLKYLAEHNHWSPFAHAFLTVRVRAPIFVARQLVKHSVGFAWNEVSRRYVNYEPSVYIPDQIRAAPGENIKQGSGDVHPDSDELRKDLKLSVDLCVWAYNYLIGRGVCPEQARMVLPLASMTEWIWSGSLAAWARMYNLRAANDTQLETRTVANYINDIILWETNLKKSWYCLTGSNNYKET